MTKFNPRKIDSHRSYSIKELSGLLGMSEKTCLRWIDEGLKTVSGGKKPILIMGDEAKEFIRKRNLKKTVTLGRYEFYCLGCRGPTRAKRGSIRRFGSMRKGVCSVCSRKINRTIGPSQRDYKIPVHLTQMSIFNNN